MTRAWATIDLPIGGEGADVREARIRCVGRTWSSRQRVHAGDVAWSAADPARETVRRLWTVADRVVAWAYADGDATRRHVDLHVSPEAPSGLVQDVVAWCHERSAVVEVPVLDREQHLLSALRTVSAEEDTAAPWFVHQVRALRGPLPQPLLPGGYHVRAVHPGEEEARVVVHRRSWAPTRLQEMVGGPVVDTGAASPFGRDAYERVTATSLYRRDLDLVVEAPDGQLVASALGWFDPMSRSGLIEPVGTDPSYAVRGLGRAACAALLISLARAGATQAVVCPRGDDGYPVPRHLYATLGMTPVARTRTYRVGAVSGAA
ncbi:GNAT family N-acetyltransferase [Luteipulveratus halotolerans]|uniref:GNAT family N-acetyltransferase n=1 Tax=Luteipulveratus halotolerans TaxID=1631356 RepID=UPI00068271BB|nr:GNAT family N-acetyltransferase [Luteipulveratus halotolerans]